jgi:lysophospholipase L1-like esterase
MMHERRDRQQAAVASWRAGLVLVASLSAAACGGSSSSPDSPGESLCISEPVDKRLAIIGDSVFDLAKQSCTQIARYLADLTGKRYPDYSVSGATLGNILLAPALSIPQQYAFFAAADAPSVVIFDGGMNDLRWLCLPADQPLCLDGNAAIEQDFRALITLLQNNGAQHLVYLGAYHLSPTGLYGDLAGSIDLWVDHMIALAAELGVIYIDPRAVFDANADFLATDGLHPSARGSAQLAELIRDALLANGIQP